MATGAAIRAGDRARSTTTVVVCGVAGAGKTVVGWLVASRLGWTFADADSFHTQDAVAAMSGGRCLTDQDRWPWLRRITVWIGEQESAGRSAVLSCSALKRAYRDLLAAGHPSVTFAQLTADEPVLRQRIVSRPRHFMPATLLASQLADLEALDPAERGIALHAEGSPEAVADLLVRDLKLRAAKP